MTATEPALPAISGASDTRVRWLPRLGALLSVATFGEAIGIVAIGSGGHPAFQLELNFVTIGFLATIVLYTLVGALIVQRRPLTPVAWLMILLGLGLGFGLLTAGYGVVGQPYGWPLAIPALILSQLFFLPSLGGATTLLLLLFPTDRLPGRAWRIVVVICLVGLALAEIAAFFRPGAFDPVNLPDVRNPFSAPDELTPLVTVINGAGSGLLVMGFLLATISLMVRYRHAVAVEAAQIRWVAFVALVAVPVITLGSLPLGPVSQVFSELGPVVLACMPIAIGIAITRYRLYDIDRLINRTIVYGALSAILAGVFAAGTAVGQRVFLVLTGNKSDAALVAATLIVATLYTPLKKRLDLVVDRRFKYEQARFGSYRDELEKTLSLVDAEAVAQRLAREVARETGATDVAVVGASGRPTAVIGRWPIPEGTTIPIPGGGGTLASLVLSSSAGRRPLDDRRRGDIEAIAGLAARAVRRPDGR